jgi:ADP-ribose pyrophosphatase YjhB (NUDIX family)
MMKFCSYCGGSLANKVPYGDDRLRAICSNCSEVHYENPKIIVCALSVWEDKVLLCKRAIEPQLGLWTLPGGFMELNETMQQAAARETWEEAGTQIKVGELFSAFNVLSYEQVHLFFLATMKSSHYLAGPESLEVCLVGEEQIPWDQIAFPAVAVTLQEFFKARTTGNYQVRLADITRGVDNTPNICSHNFTHDYF